jgi:hypothetical protein
MIFFTEEQDRVHMSFDSSTLSVRNANEFIEGGGNIYTMRQVAKTAAPIALRYGLPMLLGMGIDEQKPKPRGRQQSEKYFGGAAIVSSAIPSDLPTMVMLAHKCVSVQLLLEFNERVVQPYRSAMTVKQVVEEIIKPATKDQ